jgi:3-deoxy-7-phosphoheptulonate synthase
MFLSPDKSGHMTIYQTSGNPYGHIIMRGGKKPNYHAQDIAACETLAEFDLPEHLVVDFSHGNCQKQHRRQLDVCDEICQQIRSGSTAVAGIMAESFIKEGTQKIVAGQQMVYGQSITDPCLSWEDSELLELAAAVDTRFDILPALRLPGLRFCPCPGEAKHHRFIKFDPVTLFSQKACREFAVY